MARLLFVPNPHLRLDQPWTTKYVPLELLSAMATAEAAGAEPVLFDLNGMVEKGELQVDGRVWQEAARSMALAEPALVVMETASETLHNTLQLAKALRVRAPSIPLVLNGPGTSAVATEVLLDFSAVDGVLRGEPEPALEVLARQDLKRELPAAPGLARRIPRGVKDAPPVWVEDLEQIPRAAYHLAPMQPGDGIPVESGRGCEEGCVYCPMAGHWSPIYRPRDVESLAKEMKYLSLRYPGEILDLQRDPIFFTDLRRLEALCKELLTADVRWTCKARADLLDSHQLELMEWAGCCRVVLGVESGCPKAQQQSGRALDLSQVEANVAAVKPLDMEVRTSFIVGMPGEDVASLARTAELMMKVRRAGAAEVSATPLKAFPGSPIHDQLAGRLFFEPMLCTAAPEDHKGRQMIKDAPSLFPASYRVPVGMSGRQILAAWVLLSGLFDVVYALWRQGVNMAAVLDQMLREQVPAPYQRALEFFGQRLLDQTRAIKSVDHLVLEDLLKYTLARFHVSGQPAAPRVEVSEEGLELLCSSPGQVIPRAAVPWRVVTVRTDLDRLLQGDVSSEEGPVKPQAVLVAGLSTEAGSGPHTRRSYSVECIPLDLLGAALMPLCEGSLYLEEISHRVAAKLRRAPASTLDACKVVVEDLIRRGLLDLEF